MSKKTYFEFPRNEDERRMVASDFCPWCPGDVSKKHLRRYRKVNQIEAYDVVDLPDLVGNKKATKMQYPYYYRGRDVISLRENPPESITQLKYDKAFLVLQMRSIYNEKSIKSK